MNVFTFRYKQELDCEGIPRLVLFAEEVQTNRDLVTGDAKAKACTVRYDAAIAMLVNELFKQHRTVEELNRKIQQQDVTITQLKEQMGIVVTCLKERDSKIQKVGTQLELSRHHRERPPSSSRDPAAPIKSQGRKIQEREAMVALR